MVNNANHVDVIQRTRKPFTADFTELREVASEISCTSLLVNKKTEAQSL